MSTGGGSGPSPAQQEMAEYYKHKKAFLMSLTESRKWKVGTSGSISKLWLLRTHTVFMTGTRFTTAAWNTPMGRYLALACLATSTFYSQWMANAERQKNAELMKQITEQRTAREMQLGQEVAELKQSHKEMSERLTSWDNSWLNWRSWFKEK